LIDHPAAFVGQHTAFVSQQKMFAALQTAFVSRLVAFAAKHAPRDSRLVPFVSHPVPFLAAEKNGKAGRFVTAIFHNTLRDGHLVPNGRHTKTYGAVAAPSNEV
jgi:hypothetical protein